MVKRTYQAILSAFNHLLEERRFEDITIADIIEESEVSKATFYRYFRDKYDVMNSNYKDLLDNFLTVEECTGYRDLYFNLYNAGETDLRRLKGAFQTIGVNSFERYIYSYSKQIVIEITALNREQAGISPAEDMQLDVFCWGISFMYRNWIIGNTYDLNADEAADKLYEMMPESLKQYWIPKGQALSIE